jgi:mannose/fructose-specific phosphotransferase system component IIA
MSEEAAKTGGAAVRGILLAHGYMARGMADAVRKISGSDEDALMPLSNEGKSPDVLQEELEALFTGEPTIVFVDLTSGSCALSARNCCRQSEERAVVFGVNLPLLLDFVFNRSLSLEELVPRLLEKGKAGLTSTPEYTSHAHSPVSG